jgi:hypothetical protein
MGTDASAVSALVGLDGFVVLAQVDLDGEWCPTRSPRERC